MRWNSNRVPAPGQMNRFAHLLGRQVCVALANGSRVDDCLLVSAPNNRAQSVWIYAGGEDHFLPHDAVVDIWEARA